MNHRHAPIAHSMIASRAAGAPAYYLGRSADVWLTAIRRRPAASRPTTR